VKKKKKKVSKRPEGGDADEDEAIQQPHDAHIPPSGALDEVEDPHIIHSNDVVPQT